MALDPKSIKRLIDQVDDTCNYIIEMIIEKHLEAQTLRRQGMEPDKVQKLYKEAAQLYKQIFPIAGRCKFLYQDPQVLELLLYLEQMNGDRKYNKNKPPYFNNTYYEKKKK